MATKKSVQVISYHHACTYRLVREPSTLERVQFTTSRVAADYARQLFGDELSVYECFYILLLDRANNISNWVKISQGGISGTVVDSKLILKYAIEALASGIILLHNHPSGNKYPSDADKKLTDKVIAQAAYMDIPVLDHIILTAESYFSFADEGMV
jgi:DNA repair protein RadC